MVIILIAKDINPFIRTAFTLSKPPLDIRVICADCRLFYVFEGCGQLQVEDKTIEFKKDSLYLWKSGTKYRWDFSKNNIPRLAIINFDYDQKYRHIQTPLELITNDRTENILPCNTFSEIDLLNDAVILENANIFRSDVMEIMKSYECTAPFSKELAEINLKKLIIKIVQHITESSHSVSKLSPILDYIHRNYNTEISNRKLAEIINYHPHHVNLLMKKYTGTTLHSYITQYRMNEALKMLANTDKSIEVISTETGYKNPSHFHKIFKQIYGISPSEYRKSTNVI